MKLKWVERKRIRLENHLARIRQDIRDDVAANYACSPVNHDLGDATSPSSNYSDSNDWWINTSGSNWCVTNVSIFYWLFTRLNMFTQITYFNFVLIRLIICRIVDRRCIFIFPRRLIFIYMRHIIGVTFMPFFVFSFKSLIAGLSLSLFIVLSLSTFELIRLFVGCS